MSTCVPSKFVMSVLFLCMLLAWTANTRALSVNKYAAVVVDYDSGQVLFARNAHAQRFPASLTKIMTLYMVFEALDNGTLRLDQPLVVSRNAANEKPTKLGLKPGRTITVEDAILSLVTKSANDISTAIAENIAGSETAFCQQMTARAQSLGMKNTVFHNAHGLPHPRQTTTAIDMAKLSIALIKHYPHHYHYFNRKHFHYNGKRYKNHNRLLKWYDGVDGIKTGYIRASGYNLVASAKRNGRRIIAVVMGGKTARSRDRHVAELLDNSFERAM